MRSSPEIIYAANIRLHTTKAHTWQILKTCEALALAGNKVTLLVPPDARETDFDAFAHYQLKPVFVIKRLSVWTYPRWERLNFWLKRLSFLISVMIAIQHYPEAIVYSRDELIVWWCGLLGWRSFWELHVAKSGFLVRHAIRAAAGVIVISNGLQNFLLQQGVESEKITVVPDAVDLEAFDQVQDSQIQLRRALDLSVEKKIVCYAGRYRTMGADKGVGELIHWFAEYVQTHAQLLLLIVGLSVEEIALLHQVAEKLGLKSEQYRLVSYVDHSRLTHYLKAADVLVMNYPDTPHYARFMSPLKLFEYMASQRPILSSDLPSIREVLSEESAYLYPPEDYAAFARALDQALVDQTRAAAAYHLVNQFSWQERAAQLTRIINHA
jgi:glycosyltransferase involved in cell wall biosynthesis